RRTRATARDGHGFDLGRRIGVDIDRAVERDVAVAADVRGNRVGDGIDRGGEADRDLARAGGIAGNAPYLRARIAVGQAIACGDIERTDAGAIGERRVVEA